MSAGLAQLAAPARELLARAVAQAGGGPGPESWGVLGPAAEGGDRVTALPAEGRASRWLVFSWIGCHPDAHVPLLAALWRLEEAARATGAPVVVLRLAPIVGPRSPLVSLLAGGPRLEARLARALIQPIHEDDAVAGLARLLAGQVPWQGWHEVCGPDPLTVGELAALASAGAFGAVEASPAWQPPAAVLAAQGLAEWEPWSRLTGVTPSSMAAPGLGARA